MHQNAEFVHSHALALLDKRKNERGMFRVIRQDMAGTYMPIELACTWPQSDASKINMGKMRADQISAGISWGRNRKDVSPK
jgi:hypothetical protein